MGKAWTSCGWDETLGNQHRQPVRACPQCRLPLEPRIHHGVELDRCTACKGAWFDVTELSAALLGPARRPNAYVVWFNESSLRPQASTGQAYPACGTDSLGRAAWEKVTAAKCRSCQGVWISARDIELLRTQLVGLQSSRRQPGGPEGKENGVGWEAGIEFLQFLLNTVA